MSPVRVEHKGSWVEVVLARPEKHNAIGIDTLSELIRVGRELRKDRKIRAVILRAEGASFSSGLDIPGFMKKPSKMLSNFWRPLWRNTNNFQEVAWAWRRLPVPVIAVLHGRCYGAGVQIAMGADFRFATPDCEMSIMEAKWGLIPDMSGTVSFREVMPLDVAKRLSMTAETFTAEQGKGWGLVTETHADPLAAAHALVEQIAARSPDSVAATKFLFQRAWPASVNKAFCLERWYQLRLLLGSNQKLAVKAAQTKQPASYLPRKTDC
ncbi:MAG: crotonase/enoyl-CoA hydratase family protein [Pseudomonadota bacterium]